MRIKFVETPSRFFFCSPFEGDSFSGSTLFVCVWFHMWRLFCHYLGVIVSYGASGKTHKQKKDYSRLSFSRIPRDSLKYFEIS